MRTLLLITALFFSITIYGQENTTHRKGLTFKIGTRYLGWTDVSIPNPEDYDEEIVFSDDGHYGKSLRVYTGYFVSPKLSLSLGFGLDRYEGYGANTAPLILQGNYYLSPNKNSFFASAEVGTQIVFAKGSTNNTGSTDAGHVYALMLGKEISFSDKTGLNIYLGYNFQRSNNEGFYHEKINRKSFILGVDFVIF
ncbi:hypothetical protein [Marinilabilia rubra]|uniref:Outer membrane protein beta-barrel domain-containing protein n=1 Tax=Marinilabilia rubra TaxID=2162893 RepID=A0A2U2B395_9BACT|nr:hypothetical protein [Marinilabilia rubra]PWD97535.1 hypothetical protein DDZ16_20280 [Marinilabilia rubra]